MAEYIEKELVIAFCEDEREEGGSDIRTIINRVRNATSADVAPVVHGRWIGTHDGWFCSYSCSVCNAEALTKEETMHDQVCTPYCPNCGAKMDGDGNG